MKWEEVRRTYPDKFVKLQILESHMEGTKKYIDDMAVIKVINSSGVLIPTSINFFSSVIPILGILDSLSKKIIS